MSNLHKLRELALIGLFLALPNLALSKSSGSGSDPIPFQVWIVILILLGTLWYYIKRRFIQGDKDYTLAEAFLLMEPQDPFTDTYIEVNAPGPSEALEKFLDKAFEEPHRIDTTLSNKGVLLLFPGGDKEYYEISISGNTYTYSYQSLNR